MFISIIIIIIIVIISIIMSISVDDHCVVYLAEIKANMADPARAGDHRLLLVLLSLWL